MSVIEKASARTSVTTALRAAPILFCAVSVAFAGCGSSGNADDEAVGATVARVTAPPGPKLYPEDRNIWSAPQPLQLPPNGTTTSSTLDTASGVTTTTVTTTVSSPSFDPQHAGLMTASASTTVTQRSATGSLLAQYSSTELFPQWQYMTSRDYEVPSCADVVFSGDMFIHYYLLKMCVGDAGATGPSAVTGFRVLYYRPSNNPLAPPPLTADWVAGVSAQGPVADTIYTMTLSQTSDPADVRRTSIESVNGVLDWNIDDLVALQARAGTPWPKNLPGALPKDLSGGSLDQHETLTVVRLLRALGSSDVFHDVSWISDSDCVNAGIGAGVGAVGFAAELAAIGYALATAGPAAAAGVFAAIGLLEKVTAIKPLDTLVSSVATLWQKCSNMRIPCGRGGMSGYAYGGSRCCGDDVSNQAPYDPTTSSCAPACNGYQKQVKPGGENLGATWQCCPGAAMDGLYDANVSYCDGPCGVQGSQIFPNGGPKMECCNVPVGAEQFYNPSTDSCIDQECGKNGQLAHMGVVKGRPNVVCASCGPEWTEQLVEKNTEFTCQCDYLEGGNAWDGKKDTWPKGKGNYCCSLDPDMTAQWANNNNPKLASLWLKYQGLVPTQANCRVPYGNPNAPPPAVGSICANFDLSSLGNNVQDGDFKDLVSCNITQDSCRKQLLPTCKVIQTF
jgi:hypothetical protein